MRNILVAVVCAGARVYGHGWVISPGGFSLVWPPIGLALAAVLLWGGRVWPGVFAGVLLAEAVCGSPWMVVFGSSAGVTLAVLLARFLLGRFGGFRPPLERVQDVLGLFYFGGLVASAASASFDLCSSVLAGHTTWRGGLSVWWIWWLRDCLGILTVTPLLLTWSGGIWRPRPTPRLKEALCLLVLLCAAALLVFGQIYPSHRAGYSVAYVVFIFSLWSALRFGPRGAAATVFIVGVLSWRGTMRGVGPFAVDTEEDMFLLWDVFNSVFAMSTLILAAVIAERRRGEEQLQASKARYHHLFSHAPISIWEEDFSPLCAWLDDLRARGVVDLKDYLQQHPQHLERALGLIRVTDINEVTLKMFEADSRDRLLGELSKTIRGKTLLFFTQELLAIWNGNTHFSNEVFSHTLRGKRIDYVLHWDATTRTGKSDWTHVIVAIMDITERQRLRDEFRQAQKMEAVGRLAGGIAHDFNNLVMTIQGYSSLLLTGLEDDPNRREEAEQIKRAAERAGALTRQLLAFSRKQVMTLRVLDLNAVVSDMNKMLRRLISEHIHLEKRLAHDLGRVRADAGQLEQVIVNLAVNARDAMPKGGRLILETANVEISQREVRTQTGTLPPGRYVMLAVSDTGCGMSPSVKAHLFEPFFTTKGTEFGTGLGLSTVYGIIKQSGGEILVTSEEGQGTTFRIYLPRVLELAPTERTSRSLPRLPRGTETLLVVEDEDLVRELLCKCLVNQGYHVLEAASGPEALALAEKADRIDLLLTDIVMPLMDGKELAAILFQSRPNLKIIFHSGDMNGAGPLDGPWGTQAAFLEKPFSPNTLLLRVRDMLDGTNFFRAEETDSDISPTGIQLRRKEK